MCALEDDEADRTLKELGRLVRVERLPSTAW